LAHLLSAAFGSSCSLGWAGVCPWGCRVSIGALLKRVEGPVDESTRIETAIAAVRAERSRYSELSQAQMLLDRAFGARSSLMAGASKPVRVARHAALDDRLISAIIAAIATKEPP